MFVQLITAGWLADAAVEGNALRGSVIGGLAVAAGVALGLVNLNASVTRMWQAAGWPIGGNLVRGADGVVTKALTLMTTLLAWIRLWCRPLGVGGGESVEERWDLAQGALVADWK